MTRKSITTTHAVVSCEVCGRTLLRGEQADVFLAGGARRNVCELCTPRAVHEGWIREGLDDRRRVRAPRARDGAARCCAACASAVATERRTGRRRGRSTASEPRGRSPTSRRPPPRAGAAPAPRARVRAAARAALASTRSRRNADLKVARALELFNGQPHPRTVAGVARSLGRAARRACALGDRGQRRDDRRRLGAVAGTASRSTSPTRRPACASSRRAPS